MLAVEVAILNERGGRSHNEDSCGHWHADGLLCCVLADGAGGHGGGQIASRLAVERVLELFAAEPSVDGPQLRGLVQSANAAVLSGQSEGAERAHMHSTVVCLALDYAQHAAHWAHAGDSRLYWFRRHQVFERTRDHSVVQALIDGGMLTEAQALAHPNRSELRSALGSEPAQLEVGDSGLARKVEAGDVFLLCTDGVWECVDQALLEATLQLADSADGWLAAIELAVLGASVGHENGKEHDNFSAIAVWALDAPSSNGVDIPIDTSPDTTPTEPSP
ncbi:protein phosphatase 2C domain-containing protein [soil metagenome]